MIKLISKRYAFFIYTTIVTLGILTFNLDLGLDVLESASSSFLQMLAVLPPIMVLLGLMDVWIPRETMMKYMGPNSGAVGIFFAMLIGSLAAGPMYAAFPFTIVLIKKGVKFSNVIIFMNAWCVTKITTLLFEISALGFDFTILRLLVNIPGIILMGYLVEWLIKKEDIPSLL